MKRWIPTINANGKRARRLLTDEQRDREWAIADRLRDIQEDEDSRALRAYVEQQMAEGARTLGDLGRMNTNNTH